MKIKYYTKQQNCFIDEINALSIVIPVDITVNVAKIKKIELTTTVEYSIKITALFQHNRVIPFTTLPL